MFQFFYCIYDIFGFGKIFNNNLFFFLSKSFYLTIGSFNIHFYFTAKWQFLFSLQGKRSKKANAYFISYIEFIKLGKKPLFIYCLNMAIYVKGNMYTHLYFLCQIFQRHQVSYSSLCIGQFLWFSKIRSSCYFKLYK